MEKRSNKPHLAVPDMSYTVRQLLEKFTQGIDPGVARDVSYYEEEPSHDDLDLQQVMAMDITEKHQLRENLSNSVNQMKEEVKAKGKAKAAEAQKKAEEKPPKAESRPTDGAKNSESTNEHSSEAKRQGEAQ